MAKSGATPAPGSPEDFVAAIKKEQAFLADFLTMVKIE
jgi:hypothetical protein